MGALPGVGGGAGAGTGGGVAVAGSLGATVAAGAGPSQADSDAPMTTTAWNRRESGRAMSPEDSEREARARVGFW